MNGKCVWKFPFFAARRSLAMWNMAFLSWHQTKSWSPRAAPIPPANSRAMHVRDHSTHHLNNQFQSNGPKVQSCEWKKIQMYTGNKNLEKSNNQCIKRSQLRHTIGKQNMANKLNGPKATRFYYAERFRSLRQWLARKLVLIQSIRLAQECR